MTTPKPKTWRTYLGEVLFCLLTVGLIYFLLEPAFSHIRNNYQRQYRSIHLHSVGKAIRQAHDQPAGLSQCIRSPSEQPLLSWRVAILPYLQDPEARKLYQRFKLDEPWDSPANQTLLESMPECFTSPGYNQSPGHTLFKAFVAAPDYEQGKYRPLWSYSTKLDLNCLNPSHTILFAEVGEPIPWTKPEDLIISKDIEDNDSLLPFKLTGYFPGDYRMSDTLFNVYMADGSKRALRKPTNTPIKQPLRALIGRNDNEVVEDDIFD